MNGRAARWGGLVLGSLLALVGCGGAPPALDLTGGYASPATEYGRLLPRYTRSAELYHGFDTVAKGTATWRAPALRRAAAASAAARYQLGERAAARMIAAEERAAAEVREFHLALYTPKEQWNDLERPDTLWRAVLELPGGVRLEPAEVAFLRKTDKSAVEYPYVTPWTREYRLRFPLPEGAEPLDHLTLVLTGPLGSLRFGF